MVYPKGNKEKKRYNEMNTLKFFNGVYYANGKPHKDLNCAIKFIEKQMAREKKGERDKK